MSSLPKSNGVLDYAGDKEGSVGRVGRVGRVGEKWDKGDKGEISNHLCPMPHAQCPMTNAHHCFSHQM